MKFNLRSISPTLLILLTVSLSLSAASLPIPYPLLYLSSINTIIFTLLLSAIKPLVIILILPPIIISILLPLYLISLSLSLLNLFFIFYYLYITSRSSPKILHLRKSSQPYSGQCHLSLIIFNYILFLFHISSLLFISVLLFSITTTISSIPISSILYFLFIIIYTTFIILLIYSLTHIINHS